MLLQRGGTLANLWHLFCQKSDSKKGIHACDVRALGSGCCWATDCLVVSRRWIRGRILPGLIWREGEERGKEGATPVEACSPVSVKAGWHLTLCDVDSRHSQQLLYENILWVRESVSCGQ